MPGRTRRRPETGQPPSAARTTSGALATLAVPSSAVTIGRWMSRGKGNLGQGSTREFLNGLLDIDYFGLDENLAPVYELDDLI